MDILLDELNIIDWYDGIVIATGRRQKKAYLIVLVAWDMERSRKAFLLLDIEPSVEAEIKRSLEVDRWDEFQKVFNDVVMHYKRDVFLTFEEPANGKTLSLIQITTNELQSLRNHDVENTLTSDSLRLWFGKV